jgi:hypothetical protein
LPCVEHCVSYTHLRLFDCVVGFCVLLLGSVVDFSGEFPDRLEIELLVQLTREVLHIALVGNDILRVVFLSFFDFVELLNKLIMSEGMLLLHRFPLVLSEDLAWHECLIFLRIDQLLDLKIVYKIFLISFHLCLICTLHLVLLIYHLIQLLFHDHFLDLVLLVVISQRLIFVCIKRKLLYQTLIVSLVFLGGIAHLLLIV